MRAGSGEDRDLSHLDASGRARMVDVSAKPVTLRRALARGEVRMALKTRHLIEEGRAAKGEVLSVARIAGIQAAKRTGELIPLCHPLGLDAVAVEFEWIEDAHTHAPDGSPTDRAVLEIRGEATLSARTGVEMEALTAVSVAALTVYDMVKAADKGLEISGIRLLEKTGGRSAS